MRIQLIECYYNSGCECCEGISTYEVWCNGECICWSGTQHEAEEFIRKEYGKDAVWEVEYIEE